MYRLRVAAMAAFLLAGLVGALPSASASPHRSTLVTCGETITRSIRLANSLTACPVRGLVVGAGRITIDMDGHRIDGSTGANHFGIDDEGHSKVTIENGVIAGFQVGVNVAHASKNTVKNMTTVGNVTGVAFDQTSKSTVTRTTSVGNSNHGVAFVDGATRNTLSHGLIDGNGGEGVIVDNASTVNTIRSSDISSNGGNGINVVNALATGTRILKNKISDNAAQGVVIDAGHATVSRNSIVGNDLGGLVTAVSSDDVIASNRVTASGGPGMHLQFSTKLLVTRNISSANDGDGIALSGVTQSRIERNVTDEDGANGIDADPASTGLILRKNRADLNGLLNGTAAVLFLGIAAPGATRSSGDEAKNNSNPVQCSPGLDCNRPTGTSHFPALYQCGQTVTGTVVLFNNLTGCTADGLVVGANNTHINMRGHRITGADKTKFFDGIKDEQPGITPGFDGLAVANGVVSSFSDNVIVDTAKDGAFSAIHSVHAGNFGIFLAGCVTCSVRSSRATDTVNNGIMLSNSDHATIVGNTSIKAGNGVQLMQFDDHSTVAHNLAIADGFGFSLNKSSELEIKDNRAIDNLSGIAIADFVEMSSVTRNTAIASKQEGFLFDGLSGNVQGDPVSRNVATGNGTYGFELISASSNVFSRNAVNGNVSDGVNIDGGTGNSFVRNVFDGNDGNGLFSNNPSLRLIKNTANRNGFANGIVNHAGLGIDVPAGSVSRRNRARGNDDPHECEASDVNCFVG